MLLRARNGIYYIEIPSSYTYEDDGDNLNIYSETEVVGATHVTSYYISEHYDFVPKEELIEFISSINSSDNKEYSDVIECTSEYCYAEFTNYGTFWRVWVLFSNGKAVFISYNCDKLDMNVEKGIIDNIIKSIVTMD
jgi:hypothetical protein